MYMNILNIIITTTKVEENNDSSINQSQFEVIQN